MNKKNTRYSAKHWGKKLATHLFEDLIDFDLDEEADFSRDRSMAVFVAADFIHPLQGFVHMGQDKRLVDDKGCLIRKSGDRWIAEQMQNIRQAFANGLPRMALAKQFEKVCPYQVFWFVDMQLDQFINVYTHLIDIGGPNDYSLSDDRVRFGNEYLFEITADYSSHKWN